MAVTCVPANAQRNLPGQKAVQVTGGFVDGFTFKTGSGLTRFHSSIAYSVTNRNHSHWLLGIGYQQKDYDYRGMQKLPKAQFTGEAGYFIPVFKDRGQTFCLSLGASAMAGYETSNWGEKLLYDGSTLMNRDCFIWGGALTAEFETYITDRLILLANIRQRGLFGTTMGNFHTQVGVGLKIIIN